MDYQILNYTDNVWTINQTYSVVEHLPVVLIVMHAVTFLISCSLNGLVVKVICSGEYEKTTWDVFFIFYSVQNVFITILLDVNFTTNSISNSWILPHWICPAVVFCVLFFSCFSAITITTLAFTSLLFYRDANKRNKLIEIVFIILNVIISAAASIPAGIFTRVMSFGHFDSCTVEYPSEHFRFSYDIAIHVLFFLCPVVAALGLTACYLITQIRSKNVNKTVILRVLTIALYLVFWTPYWAVSFLFAVSSGVFDVSYIQLLWALVQWFVTLGCCIHPLMYILLQPKLWALLHCKCSRSSTADDTVANMAIKDGTTMETQQ